MRMLFVTDLHGDRAKYRRILSLAKEKRAYAVINGGDMLPKGGSLHFDQRSFITDFLDAYFEAFEAAGIYHLGYLGNDDLKIHDALFQDVCSKYSRIVNLARTKVKLNAFEIIGMNWVVDYPFQLKDRCRKDIPGYKFQRQFGPGLLSKKEGFDRIPDWFTYAATLPTIEEEMDKLPLPEEMSKAIYVVHMPPADMGLDVCATGAKVGSEAIYKFILKSQPLLTLHGHIHESPAYSFIWKAQAGKTVCVQPGQLDSGRLSYVLFDPLAMKIERIEESV